MATVTSQWGVDNGLSRQLSALVWLGVVVSAWLCMWGGASAPAAYAATRSHASFPVPKALRPNVAFWTRVFTAMPVETGVLHDTTDVSIIYHAFHSLPTNARQRRRLVTRRTRHYRRVLTALARHGGRPRNAEEKRVLTLFPEARRTTKGLRTAARNIRFQQGMRERFRRSLMRSGAFLPSFRRIFAEAGLPQALTLLPHIESGFDQRAYSPARAAGLWQFIPSTGRRFLTINAAVDERLDSHRATVAAATLLAENYRVLGTWPLAITAYNYGAHGMQKAVRTLGTTDLGDIVQRYRSRTFGFASKNFYAEFLAVVDIVANYRHHFGTLEFAKPVVYHTITLDAYVTLGTVAKYLRVDRGTIVRWNPTLRPTVVRGYRRIPKGFGLKIPVAEMPQDTLLQRWAAIPSRLKHARAASATRYRVRRGETLSTIAQRLQTTPRQLAVANSIIRMNRIRAGQLLRIPRTQKPRRDRPRSYRVRRGDTLSTIASRFGLSMRRLARANGIVPPYTIQIGQRLKVPAGPVRYRRYRVRAGDTLSTIAHRYRVSVTHIAQLNRIAHPYRIRAGQVLRLPRPT